MMTAVYIGARHLYNIFQKDIILKHVRKVTASSNTLLNESKKKRTPTNKASLSSSMLET